MTTNHESTNPRTPADMIDEIGGNPHAEIPHAPPVDFRTSPHEWIREHIGEPSRTRYGSSAEAYAEHAERAFDSLSLLLDEYAGSEMETEALARVLVLASDALSFRVREDSRFYRFGPMLVPTTPSGLAFVRHARKVAREDIGSPMLGVVDSDSPLGVVLSAIRSAAERKVSGFLESARNITSAEPANGRGFRIAFDFAARAASALPRGKALPPALLSPILDGFEVSDALELKSDCDMCDDGTAEFLDRFGISYERTGAYECDSCGAEHESDECGEIEWISDFVLTPEMVEAIDRQGFGDALREYIADGNEHADSLGALLDECDDSEIRARVALPPANESGERESGIPYDSSVWEFAPALDEIDGADEIESAQALRAGVLLGDIAREYADASVLPPIPGVLRYRPLPYERPNSSRDTIALEWNPTSGILSTTLGGGLRFEHDTRRESARIVVRESTTSAHRPALALSTETGSRFVASFAEQDAGERAALLLRIAQGSAEI